MCTQSLAQCNKGQCDSRQFCCSDVTCTLMLLNLCFGRESKYHVMAYGVDTGILQHPPLRTQNHHVCTLARPYCSHTYRLGPSFPTCQGLCACALHRPVAGCLTRSCDWPSAGAAGTIAHCAGNRAAATVKVATCRSLESAGAHCMERKATQAHHILCD